MARQEDGTVLLRATKHLDSHARQTLRCGSELALNEVNGVTPRGRSGSTTAVSC